MNNMLKFLYLNLTFVVCVLLYGCAHKETAPNQNNSVVMESHSDSETSDTKSEEIIVKSQINDTIRFIDILESSSYPFAEKEGDQSYALCYTGDDDLVDSMVALSYCRKYKNLTQKEALTIINYATNNTNGDRDATIYGSTGEVFVNDSLFFDLMVHITKEIYPDILKIKFIRLLQAGLFEYGMDLIDAEAIDISYDENDDMFNDTIWPLDSIISLRNSWAEAVKDHPVHYGATE